MLLQAKKELAKRLAARGRLTDLVPSAGVAAMLAFYREQRVDRCPLDPEGDAILFRWGTLDTGRGESFRLEIMRRFVLRHATERHQLTLTFHYVPTPALRALGAGELACPTLEDLPVFAGFLERAPAYTAVKARRGTPVVLSFERG